MRRIALFSDVHGNLAALDAVLADVRAARLPEAYCLGDLVGYGPDPAGVIETVRAAGVPTVRGNYDDGIGNRLGGCGCYYASEQARRDGEASYAYTDANVDDEAALWLASLPRELRLEHEGVRLLLNHGSPRRLNEYLLPDRPDRQLVRLAGEARADVVCVGHVHVPYHRAIPTAGGVFHYVSAGSAGKPKDGDPRACWVELLLGEAAAVLAAGTGDPAMGSAGDTDVVLAAIVHRVAYDVASVERAMLRAGLPPTLAAALRSA